MTAPDAKILARFSRSLITVARHGYDTLRVICFFQSFVKSDPICYQRLSEVRVSETGWWTLDVKKGFCSSFHWSWAAAFSAKQLPCTSPYLPNWQTTTNLYTSLPTRLTATPISQLVFTRLIHTHSPRLPWWSSPSCDSQSRSRSLQLRRQTLSSSLTLLVPRAGCPSSNGDAGLMPHVPGSTCPPSTWTTTTTP